MSGCQEPFLDLVPDTFSSLFFSFLLMVGIFFAVLLRVAATH